MGHFGLLLHLTFSLLAVAKGEYGPEFLELTSLAGLPYSCVSVYWESCVGAPLLVFSVGGGSVFLVQGVFSSYAPTPGSWPFHLCN